MGIELGFEDLMGGERPPVKVPGKAPGPEEGFTGGIGDRLIQGLELLNKIFNQWDQLSKNPQFKQLVISRLPQEVQDKFLNLGGALNPQDHAGAQEQTLNPRGASTAGDPAQTAQVIRALAVGLTSGFIKSQGDKTIDQVLKDYGSVKLSQLLMLLRGG